MELNKTAVQWLVSELRKPHANKFITHIIHKALEMEKEQIMQAYKFNATGEPDGAEHYYEMFYKKYNQ